MMRSTTMRLGRLGSGAPYNLNRDGLDGFAIIVDCGGERFRLTSSTVISDSFKMPQRTMVRR